MPSRRTALLVALTALLLFAAFAVDRRLRACAVLLRLEPKPAPAWLAHYREHPIDARDFTFEGGRGRLYRPTDVARAPGMLLAHGMHEEGITEPRLVALARALASAGFVVLTPDVVGLAHYQITHDDVVLIARAARALAREVGTPTVPVFGISFGAGLAIRAACEPAQRDAIGRLIGLGAHHDAARVSRFYLGEPARGPAGQVADVEPHPYGRVALWMSLFGERHKGAFSEEERQRVLAGVVARTPALEQASPRLCPEPLRVPLFLVHGTGDRVVPYTETLWNQRQFAPQVAVRALISPAIVHAEYAPPSWGERLTLIEFIQDALY